MRPRTREFYPVWIIDGNYQSLVPPTDGVVANIWDAGEFLGFVVIPTTKGGRGSRKT